jgi:hypothetical protein
MKSPAEVAHARSWLANLAGWPAAAVVLALFWAGMLASLRDKSIAFDEIAQATAGYTYWQYDDYRIDPPNGNLPKRLMALPLLSRRFSPPPTDSEAWKNSDAWKLGDLWWHDSGNDVRAMLARGRAVMGLVAVALGALVWWWGRRVSGPVGGMVALGLFVLNPTVLAHGALMTSDMTVALFFWASAVATWRLLERITPGRIAWSCVAASGLFLAKMSAPLIAPVAGLLVLWRTIERRPIEIALGAKREIPTRVGKLAAIGALAAVHVVFVWGAVWAAYGFRYSAFALGDDGRLPQPWAYMLDRPAPPRLLEQVSLTDEQRASMRAIPDGRSLTLNEWTYEAEDAMAVVAREVLTPEQAQRLEVLRTAPPPALTARAIDFARRHRLLPESYLYGYAHGWLFSRERIAFMNGRVSATGWRWFFPYAFVVKTPLALLALLGLALVAGAAAWWRGSANVLTATMPPVAALVLVYGAAAVTSHINIGVRHLLPVFAPLCVAGAALLLVRWGRIAAMGLFAVLVVEVTAAWPNYLAYFNASVPASRAYRHLVDSSLDWGMELPAVKRFLTSHPDDAARAYFSYFGTGRPDSYGIAARPLFSEPGHHIKGDAVMMLPVPRGVRDADVLRAWPGHEIAAVADDGRERVLLLVARPETLRLGAGTYFISATMLQPLYYKPWGPWNRRYEADYQALARAVKPLLDDNRTARADAMGKREPEEWQVILRRFEEIRFARLTAFLRQREPDDTIASGVLVYRLADADIAAALEGPPPELGPDPAD